MPPKKIAIIGSGLAGLAAAIRLAHRGNKITVFEAFDRVGGKMNYYENNGFRFDTGPSLFTRPDLVTDLLDIDGDAIPFYYDTLKTVCRYFYPDGGKLNAQADLNQFAKEIEQNTKDSAESVIKYFTQVKKLYEATAPVFLEKSLHSASTYTTTQALSSLFKVPPSSVTQSLHSFNANYWKDPKMVQLCDRFATYNGSNPYEAPAILQVVGHLEHGLGAYFPKEGMYSIADALYQKVKALGVEFKFNQRVSRIEYENKQVKGIIANEKFTAADLVVSNMDVHRTYEELLPEVSPPNSLQKNSPSSSAIIFLWSMESTFPQLDLHNIFFSDAYEEEFKAIFEQKTMSDDPTVYVNISAKKNPSDAPAGMENWFVMINAPAIDKQHWPQLIDKTRKRVVNKLSKMLDQDIAQYIKHEKVMDPRYLAENTLAHLGTLYGSSHNKKLSAFLRHPNFSSSIKGLYFCGGTVHPGGGIPLCLLSAKIVDELIERHY